MQHVALIVNDQDLGLDCLAHAATLLVFAGHCLKIELDELAGDSVGRRKSQILCRWHPARQCLIGLPGKGGYSLDNFFYPGLTIFPSPGTAAQRPFGKNQALPFFQ
jgi:hypothetical protein